MTTSFTTYHRKPTSVEAYQLTPELVQQHLLDGVELPGVRILEADFNSKKRSVEKAVFTVRDEGGFKHAVDVGSWILKDGEGHIAMSDEVFRSIYEV